MRPKNKKHKYHAQTTKNTKNKTTKKKKQTTTKQSLLLFYRIRVHYTVLTQHTTPQTTPNNQQLGILPTRGDSIEQQSCCSRHPTACQTTKQTRTQTHFAQTLTTNKAERPQKTFVSSTPKPHTQHMHAVLVFTCKQKTCHHQVLTSTQPGDKTKILYSP